MSDLKQKNKKTLLIFFGEFRTFEYVIPLLKKLDEVDIMISTWSESKWFDNTIQIDKNKVFEIIPNLKYCNIIDIKKVHEYNLQNNALKMQYHWKTSINSIENSDEYDNVILHRTDLLSNWHTILDLDIEDDNLYLQYGDYLAPYWVGPNIPDIFWVNDYYFFGKFDIVKKFVNLFTKKQFSNSHQDMWEVVKLNNFKIKKYILNGVLIRDSDIQNNEYKKNNSVDFLALLTGPGSPIEKSPFSLQNQ